uniref:ORF-A n=3 Tax=Elephantid herpesvirus 1 TaxID=146015 RepID=A0AA97AM57_ELHV1|nr:ORF-A [Elephant endotheliotropic herpesvirus 1A]
MMKYRFSSNSVSVWLTACREGYFLSEIAVLEEADELPENEKTMFHSFHAQLRNVICGTMAYPYTLINEKDDTEKPEHLLEIQLQKYKKYKREEMIYSLALMKAACKVYMRIRQVPVLHHQCINLETFIVSLFEEGKRVFNALCSVEDAAVYVGIGSINQRVTRLAKETIAVFKSRVYKKALGRQLNMDNEFMLPFNISTVVKANDSRFLLGGIHSQTDGCMDDSETAANSASARIIYKEQTIIEDSDYRRSAGGVVGCSNGSAITVLDRESKKGLIQDIYAFYNPVTNGLGHIKIKLKTEPPQIISIYLPTSRAVHLANTTKWNFPVSLTKRGIDETDDYYEQVPIKRIKTAYSKPDPPCNNEKHSVGHAVTATNTTTNVVSALPASEEQTQTFQHFEGCSLHYNVLRDNTTTYHHHTCPKNKDNMALPQIDQMVHSDMCTAGYGPMMDQATALLPPILQPHQTKVATVRPHIHQDVETETVNNNTESFTQTTNTHTETNIEQTQTGHESHHVESELPQTNTDYEVSAVLESDDLQACLDELINATSPAELFQMGNGCSFDWLLNELDLELDSENVFEPISLDDCNLGLSESNDYIGLT